MTTFTRTSRLNVECGIVDASSQCNKTNVELDMAHRSLTGLMLAHRTEERFGVLWDDGFVFPRKAICRVYAAALQQISSGKGKKGDMRMEF